MASIVLSKPLSITQPQSSGIGDGVSVENINGQNVLVLRDSNRQNKQLSVSDQILVFSNFALSHLDWISIGNVSDADSSYVADLNATITGISVHCENARSNSKDLNLYIDGVDVGSIGNISGGANVTLFDPTLDIDINQGQRIRLRAVGNTSGSIGDIVIKLTIKWRV